MISIPDWFRKLFKPKQPPITLTPKEKEALDNFLNGHESAISKLPQPKPVCQDHSVCIYKPPKYL